MMNIFSDRKISQSPLPGSYGRHFFRDFPLYSWIRVYVVTPDILRQVVVALLLSCLKLFLCKLYLVLKASSVLPVYSALFLLCVRVAL